MRALLLLAQFAPISPESSNAEGIRDSYLFVSIFTFAIFLLVEGLLIAFIYRYRRRKRPRFEDGAQISGASRLEASAGGRKSFGRTRPTRGTSASG